MCHDRMQDLQAVSQRATAGALLSCKCNVGTDRQENNRAVRQDGTHDRLPHLVEVKSQSLVPAKQDGNLTSTI